MSIGARPILIHFAIISFAIVGLKYFEALAGWVRLARQPGPVGQQAWAVPAGQGGTTTN